VPDFSLSFSGGGSNDGTVEIEQGASLDVTVNVQGSGGFNGVVTLSSGVETAQVTGIDIAFDPATTGTSSTMTIDIGAGVDFTDDYTLTVTGASGSITRNATLTIDVTEATTPVGSIALSAATTDLTLVQSSSRDVTLTVTPDGGFSGDVDLTFSDAGSGISGVFGTDPVTVNAATNSTLTLAADGTVTPGVYTVTVTATSGTLTDSVEIEVRVITASAVRYVNADSGNDTTGDGSAGNPLATIAQALTDLSGTGTIFLQAASATYDGGFTLADDLVLEGTGGGVGDAVIAGAAGNGILLQGGTVTLRNLTIDGFENGIRNNSGTSTLTLDRVTIDGASADGIAVSTVGTTLTLDATDLTLTDIGGDGISLGNNSSSTGPSITATFTNLSISGGSGEAIDFKGSNALDVTFDNATISNAGDNGIELDSGVASGASFVMRNSTITGSTGIGMIIEAAGATTIDIGTNNTISGSGGIELSDQRANGDSTVIAAGGLTLNASDPTGTATGVDSDGDLWEILGTGNQIAFD
jgi:hypothetical protein